MVSELEAWGVDVWVDTGEILAGEAWRRTIEENFERLVRSLISLGLDVQPKLEPKVTKDIEIEKQSTSNSAALASISQPDSATSSITTSNLFQSIPV